MVRYPVLTMPPVMLLQDKHQLTVKKITGDGNHNV